MAADLIRIDTTNAGDSPATVGERAAARYVAARLAETGYEPVYVESAPGRGNVVARLPGADPSRGALLIHGHLDVVPADPADWAVHPLSGEIRDGYLWGRGAVDMKGMCGMVLAVARAFRRHGVVPPRDLVFAFVADEETGGFQGARWLVDNRGDLFDGVTEAIGEVGGFSITLPGRAAQARTRTPGSSRVYLVQTAEKGSVWLRLRADGTAGHGSLADVDNALVKLAAAVTRLSEHRFPTVLTGPVRDLLSGYAALLGEPFDDKDPAATVARMGSLSRWVGASLRDTANVTVFQAGARANMIPSIARAEVDGRVLPGREAAFRAEIEALLGPDIMCDWRMLPVVESPSSGRLVDAMAAAISAEDPGATILPYLTPAGTDAKAFAQLGIHAYGFAPLRLPPGLDFTALFHGVDERVPVDALRFGTAVLDRLLRTC